jgi:hypothetical protein
VTRNYLEKHVLAAFERGFVKIRKICPIIGRRG